MKTVMTFGTFDFLHPGHVSFLKQAKKHGRLIVVIARNKTVKRLKGKLPHHTEKQRQKGVSGLKMANKVVLGSLNDKYSVIRKYKPDIIALGYDQTHFTEDLKNKFKNIKIIRLKPFKPNKYKTSIIKYGQINKII